MHFKDVIFGSQYGGPLTKVTVMWALVSMPTEPERILVVGRSYENNQNNHAPFDTALPGSLLNLLSL